MHIGDLNFNELNNINMKNFDKKQSNFKYFYRNFVNTDLLIKF